MQKSKKKTQTPNTKPNKNKKSTSISDFIPSEETIYEIKSSLTTRNIIFTTIIVSLILMIFFQYKYEKKTYIGYSEDESSDEDYYTTLGLEPGVDLYTIRKQYKKLAKIWHPDKHPNCETCKEKFAKITTAHEELIKQHTEGGNDKNSIFTSHPIRLTSKNYHQLVEKSNDFWLIFVYEKARMRAYSQKYTAIFDEVVTKYQSIIKFGVIDVIKEEKLLTYLPFKFPILPNIYTHFAGHENELYQQIHSLSYLNLIKFMEDSFKSEVKLVTVSTLKKIVNDKGKQHNFISTKNNFIQRNLNAKIILLSPKNYINIVVKDFNKRYETNCEIYQNDLGYYDDAVNLFNDNYNRKMFISFNDYNNTLNSLTQNIIPIPVSYKPNAEDIASRLQISFELVKKLMMPKISKNNYIKHCTNKLDILNYMSLNGDDNDKTSNAYKEDDDDKTSIDLCVIELKGANDKINNENELNKEMFISIINNFKKNIKRAELSPSKRKEHNINDEYHINVNYGYVELKQNKKLLKFYNDYLTSKEQSNDNNPHDNSKMYLIINHSHEKFSFKSFNDANTLKDYFNNLNDPDFYEDISIGFDYFNTYDIRDISNLFNEEKIFSILQILIMSIYAQTQVTCITLFVMIFFTVMYILKYSSTKAVWFTVNCILLSLIFHFFYFAYISLYSS